MKKKNVIKIGIALVLAVVAIMAVKSLTKPTTVKGSKEVQLIVSAENTILFNESLNTDAELLGQLLDECVDNKKLDIVFDDSNLAVYGSRMIMGINQYNSDPVSGPWWMVYSDTNPDALKAGFCTGIDQQTIYDKDIFELKFESY